MILRLNLIIVAIIGFLFFVQHLYANEKNSDDTNKASEVLKQELIELEKESDKITNIFKKVVQLVGPSVVKIKMKKEMNIAEKNKDGEDLLSAHHPEAQPNSHNEKEFNLYKTFKLPERDVGSGFIIDKNGLIVTNYHVIKNFSEKQIEVTLYNNQKYIGEIIGFDPRTDLAVLKIEGDTFQSVAFGDDTGADIGDWVIAIGNPYGHRQTISTGVISATGQKHTDSFPTTLTYEDFMQTDAAINPGSSGGPLVNMRGEVIGINAAIATRRGSFSGIGFAIPASIVKKVVKELIENDEIRNR